MTIQPSSLLVRPSRRLKLPRVYVLWLGFGVVLGIGNLLLNFHIAVDRIFPPIFLLGAALPVMAVLASANARLGSPLTWRQGLLALVVGSTLSVLVAVILEIILPFLVLYLIPPLWPFVQSAREGIAGAPGGATGILLSPLVVLLLLFTAIQAPIPEEFAKALGVPFFGRARITNARQALMIGMFCGAGFAIMENMVYEGIYAQQNGWNWGGVTLLRGIGAVVHPLGTGLVALGWFRARDGGWGELFKGYLAAVGLHTLWNGGFAALVLLTGINQNSEAAAVINLYGVTTALVLVLYLVALALALWFGLAQILNSLSIGIQSEVVPTIVSARALALLAFACLLVLIPLGASLSPAWSAIQAVLQAGPR